MAMNRELAYFTWRGGRTILSKDGQAVSWIAATQTASALRPFLIAVA
jgi:hypothetical protein